VNTHSADRVKDWNAFKTRDQQPAGDKIESFFGTSTKALKVFIYLFIACGVIILNVLSKGSLLLAASNLRPPHKAEFTSISQLPENYLLCRNHTEVMYKNVTQQVNHMALCVMMSRDRLPDGLQTDDPATYCMTPDVNSTSSPCKNTYIYVY
jgi:hypothetical protein